MHIHSEYNEKSCLFKRLYLFIKMNAFQGHFLFLLFSNLSGYLFLHKLFLKRINSTTEHKRHAECIRATGCDKYLYLILCFLCPWKDKFFLMFHSCGWDKVTNVKRKITWNRGKRWKSVTSWWIRWVYQLYSYVPINNKNVFFIHMSDFV